MTQAEARALLRSFTQASSEPTLSDAEITSLLGLARRADRDANDVDAYVDWTTMTALTLGALIVAVPRNGRYCEVTTAGSTGATQPTWPTLTGQTVTNGSVTFTDRGPAPWTPAYDLYAAAAEGWRWKAGKVAGCASYSADGLRVDRGAIAAECREMVDLYLSKMAQSVSLARFTGVVDPNYGEPYDVVGND